MMKCFQAGGAALEFRESEALVSPSNNHCPSSDESNGVSLFHPPSSRVNNAIIINGHSFAYPDCGFEMGKGASALIRSW